MEPTEELPKKSHILLIAIIAVAFLAIAGSGYYFYINKQKKNMDQNANQQVEVAQGNHEEHPSENNQEAFTVAKKDVTDDQSDPEAVTSDEKKAIDRAFEEIALMYKNNDVAGIKAYYKEVEAVTGPITTESDGPDIATQINKMYELSFRDTYERRLGEEVEYSGANVKGVRAVGIEIGGYSQDEYFKGTFLETHGFALIKGKWYWIPSVFKKKWS